MPLAVVVVVVVVRVGTINIGLMLSNWMVFTGVKASGTTTVVGVSSSHLEGVCEGVCEGVPGVCVKGVRVLDIRVTSGVSGNGNIRGIRGTRGVCGTIGVGGRDGTGGTDLYR